MNHLSFYIKTFLSINLMVFLIIMLLSCNEKKQWNIKDYGAKGDGFTINTKAIQHTIDACSSAGGGIVIVEGGIYITGTVLLKNNVEIQISKNASLVGSVNPNDYQSIDPFVDATGQLRGKCLIGALDVQNIAITGKGIIDGRGNMFTYQKVAQTLKELGEQVEEVKLDVKDSSLYAHGRVSNFDRPFLVRFVRSQNIKLRNIHVRQPAAWTLHFYKCKNFELDSIVIYSHANKNNDAIDIDSSFNGLIQNCNIDSGDDAICFKTTSPLATENIKVKGCKIKSEWGAIKFGTESMGDFKNISIENCLIYDTRGGGIKVLSVDGAGIKNISINNIKMVNVEMPIFIRLGERGLTYRNAKKRPVGTIDNVSITNITASVPETKDLRLKPTTGIFITGTPKHKVGYVKLHNIKIDLPGNVLENNAIIEVPENETKYPEFTNLGPTPAYGIYARHAKVIDTFNISIKTRVVDNRKEVIFKNVKK